MAISLDKLNEKIMMLCAVFSTMPIVAVPIMGHTISLFTILLFIFIAINMPMFFSGRNTKLCSNKSEKLLLIWLLWGIFSGVCGMLYYSIIGSETFASSAISQIPKIIMYIMMVVIIYNSKLDKRRILKGLIIGCVINLIWAVIDAMFFYLSGISITNVMFKQFIVSNNVRFGQISIILNGGGIRSAGLNTDPANIGFFAPIVFYYALKKDNKILAILALLSELASMSTTSLVCTAIITVIYLVDGKKEKKRKRISLKSLGLIVISIILVAVFTARYMDVIVEQVDRFFTRVNTIYVEGMSDNNRVNYIKNLPTALKNENLRVITGTGYLTASHGYINTDIDVYGPYDMENRYLANLFDLGVFGSAVFFYMLYVIYKRGKRQLYEDKEYLNIFKGIFFSLIISCMFYQYPLYTVHILFFVSIASLEADNKKTDE